MDFLYRVLADDNTGWPPGAVYAVTASQDNNPQDGISEDPGGNEALIAIYSTGATYSKNLPFK